MRSGRPPISSSLSAEPIVLARPVPSRSISSGRGSPVGPTRLTKALRPAWRSRPPQWPKCYNRGMSIESTRHLLTMNELAEYVGRHPQQLRKYYAAGMLAEPKHRIIHDRKTTRRFTLKEAAQKR